MEVPTCVLVQACGISFDTGSFFFCGASSCSDMSETHYGPTPEPRRWTTLERTGAVAFGALVLFHCLAVLSFSARHGRLAMVPVYDDVDYLIDGVKRLSTFDRQGFPGLASSFLQHAPHAPYSSLLATVGFGITPKNMLGAYALNAIWVVVFLALLQRLLRSLPPLTQMGIMIASLAVPILSTVIGSFRPDTYWGLITGAVAVIVATRDLGRATRVEMILTGLLVGGAALSKPTGMPAGSFVMGVGYLGAIAAALIGGTATPRQIVTKTLFMLLGVAILVIPFLIVSGRDLLNYILAVMGKDSAVWRTDGSLSVQLAYYLNPYLFFGTVGWLLPAGPVLLLAWLVTAGLSRDRALFARTLGVYASLLVAYAIPAISPIKSWFIGSLFYGTFIAGAFWSLAQMLRAKPVPGTAVLLVGSAVFAVFWRPGTPLIAMESESYAAMDRANRAVTPSILEVLAAGAAQGQTLSVYSSSPGPVFDATVQYEALLRAIPSTYSPDYTNPDWSSILAKAQIADIVIASDAGALGQGGWSAYPGIQYQDRLIATLAADATWRKLTTYVDEAGFKTIVFTRFVPASAKLSFGAGFRPQEGPFPDKRLPKFHWMIADTATLTVRDTAGAAASKSFGLQCESIADLNLSVLDATGRMLVTSEIRAKVATGQFDKIIVPHDSGAGSSTNLSLKLKAPGVATGPWPGLVLCAALAVATDLP
jgi:hypothetical protein